MCPYFAIFITVLHKNKKKLMETDKCKIPLRFYYYFFILLYLFYFIFLQDTRIKENSFQLNAFKLNTSKMYFLFNYHFCILFLKHLKSYLKN